MFWFVGFASGTFGGFFLLKRECVSGIVEAAQQYLGHWLVASGPAIMFCPVSVCWSCPRPPLVFSSSQTSFTGELRTSSRHRHLQVHTNLARVKRKNVTGCWILLVVNTSTIVALAVQETKESASAPAYECMRADAVQRALIRWTQPHTHFGAAGWSDLLPTEYAECIKSRRNQTVTTQIPPVQLYHQTSHKQ